MKRVEDEAKARMRLGTDVGGREWGGEMVPLGIAAPGGRRRKKEGLFEVIGFSLFSEDSELEPV